MHYRPGCIFFHHLSFYGSLTSKAPTQSPTFQLYLNLPLYWKASLRLCSTSANNRTSFTSCITYSTSTPGAPIRREVRPMLLRGFGFFELRPIFKVLLDPADRGSVDVSERFCGSLWVCFVPPPPPPLLLLPLPFRSIPAFSAAATLYWGYSRPANPWTQHAALVRGQLKDREWRVDLMSICRSGYYCYYFNLLYYKKLYSDHGTQPISLLLWLLYEGKYIFKKKLLSFSTYNVHKSNGVFSHTLSFL